MTDEARSIATYCQKWKHMVNDTRKPVYSSVLFEGMTGSPIASYEKEQPLLQGGH